MEENMEGVILVDPKGQIAFRNSVAAELFPDAIPTEGLLFLQEKELMIRTFPLDKSQLILIQDVTEIKKLQALSLRHDRMKELGEMVATVAHEIRNPLGGIRGFASLLHRDLKEQPEQQAMAQHIIEGADHLSRFVTSVLNYSRPLQLHLERKNLNELVEELRGHMEADNSLDSRIQVKCILSPHPVFANVDAPLLQSALLNLIVNAIQAMPEGGELSLIVKQGLIQVKDTGIGIAPENMPKLFSPFFTTRENGNGFGLVEVKKIVQAHGGTISVASEVGQGTTFNLELI